MPKPTLAPVAFDATIDELRLDYEWLRQPTLYFEWATRLADVRRDVAHAKAEIDVVKAELSRAIWADPGAYGLTKATGDTVPPAILEQLEYKSAVTAHLDLQHRADVIAAAVAALDQRRRALENLVDLHGRNYFSTPRAKPGTEEAVADIERNARRQALRRQEEVEE